MKTCNSKLGLTRRIIKQQEKRTRNPNSEYSRMKMKMKTKGIDERSGKSSEMVISDGHGHGHGHGLDQEGEEELQFRLQMFDLDDPQVKKLRIYQEAIESELLYRNSKTFDDKPVPELALEYYKTQMKGGDYEFVELKRKIPADFSVTHMNFTARLKGSYSEPQLFFAELKRGRPKEITHCCKLDRPPFPLDGPYPPDVFMLHCDCFKCKHCESWAEERKRNGNCLVM